jgi:hypothetical protein
VKSSQKCTAILAVVGSTLILHSSPAMAVSNINNEGESIQTSIDKLTIEEQLPTTTSSAVTLNLTASALQTTSGAVTLVDLQNKIDSAVAKVIYI